LQARRYPRLWVVLALIVLIAQAGAQAHAYAHLSSRTGSPTDLQHGRPAACGDCLAFAPLLAAASGTAFPVVPTLAPASMPVAAGIAAAHRSFALTAYRSRAPPVHP
jgi:hypothetical protein